MNGFTKEQLLGHLKMGACAVVIADYETGISAETIPLIEARIVELSPISQQQGRDGYHAREEIMWSNLTLDKLKEIFA